MKVKITQTAIKEIDDEVYKEWMSHSEIEAAWNTMSDEEKLEIIKDCEEECDYDIVNETDSWTTTLELA
jgi:predicted Fe-S protein YdhL (DUF1289 family)